MLNFIRILRFKTLLDSSFPLSKLNLFSGLNGMGKSSVIQSLLLLRQSNELNVLEKKGLLLNGSYVKLGVGQDVLSSQTETDSIEFHIKWDNISSKKFEFAYSPDSDLQPTTSPSNIQDVLSEGLFGNCFQYLSADRIPPKTHHEVSDFSLSQLNSIGNHGEYAVQYIAEYGSKALPHSALRHSKANSETFLDNLNAWMSELSPGVKIRASKQPKLNVANLAFAFEQGKDITDEFKPQNVGFGLSYVLPVATALLKAKSGDLLIIENPESHLHPAGQSAIGKMCALAASAGVQLILETHSDHFLNGIRVSARNGNILPDDICLYYLSRFQAEANHASLVQCPKIDSDGRINIWPEGFFDEWDKSLEQLL